MSDYTIIIGNKNYSSWSLRGWLALKRTGVDFDEILIALDQADTMEKLANQSPSAKVPALKTPDGEIWDSLAISEYLAETFPDAGLWPKSADARAHARAVSAEMHSGFPTLRAMMPMDMKNTYPMPELSDELKKDITRIDAIWQDCRRRFGQGGPFLYGSFTIADCMFAPVVSRFTSYGTAVSQPSQDYITAVLQSPEMIEWSTAAKQESWVIDY